MTPVIGAPKGSAFATPIVPMPRSAVPNNGMLVGLCENAQAARAPNFPGRVVAAKATDDIPMNFLRVITKTVLLPSGDG